MKTKKSKIKSILLFLILSAIPFLNIVNCELGTPPDGDGGGGGSTNGTFYALDDAADAIYAYDGPNSLNGEITQSRTITGSDTKISNATAMAVDPSRDILYVTDTTDQNVLVFAPASTQDGNKAPARKYPGVKKAGALFIDEINDRLYVADVTDKEIKVWNGVSTLADGAALTRSIKLDFVPAGFTVDTKKDILYIGDPTSTSVKAYVNASTLSGNATPSRTIKNSTTAFVNLNGLAMNSDTDLLFVSESGGKSVEMFDQASTLNGDVAATRELKGGNTGFTINQRGILFRSNSIYVIQNDTAVGVWDNANQLKDDVAPTRALTLKGASRIISIALDPAN
ncbi:MAG: hypothetical protein JNK65_02715 [Deltaproteobacteria bacterium]|nr:hypothetical protein [Deltaproteobacteria bacterium]